MKKMFTLLLSLMAFSTLFAQYNRGSESNRYNNRNAPYHSGYSNNSYDNYADQNINRHHEDGNFQPYDHNNFDRGRLDEHRMEGYRPEPAFGYADHYRDRDGWRRHHRGFGALGTGLLIGGVIGVAIASHH